MKAWMIRGSATIDTSPVIKNETYVTIDSSLNWTGGIRTRKIPKIEVIIPTVEINHIPLWGWGIWYALGTFGLV